MRWESLFADLEGQAAAAEAAGLAAEVADRTRREVAALRLADRLRAATGAELTVAVAGGRVLRGTLLRSGPDWCIVAAGPGPEAVIPLAAVTWLRGLPSAAAAPGAWGRVEARLDLAYLLRAVARDRATVELDLTDGGSCTGTIDRVGADLLDLAEHLPDEPRRRGAVRGIRTVPLAAVAVLRLP